MPQLSGAGPARPGPARFADLTSAGFPLPFFRIRSFRRDNLISLWNERFLFNSPNFNSPNANPNPNPIIGIRRIEIRRIEKTPPTVMKPVRRPPVQAKMDLLGEREYLNILNSEGPALSSLRVTRSVHTSSAVETRVVYSILTSSSGTSAHCSCVFSARWPQASSGQTYSCASLCHSNHVIFTSTRFRKTLYVVCLWSLLAIEEIPPNQTSYLAIFHKQH